MGLFILMIQTWHTPISSVCKAPVDPTGAGDSTMAAMAVCLANGIPMDAAVRFANEVAAISCERMGTIAVSLDMLEKRVQG
ncbi:MAG: PfkB family carbohydrate kinase [Clostridia bacterium]